MALLQISTHDTLFPVSVEPILGLPDFLEEFLQNDVLKVGLSLKDEFCNASQEKYKRSAQRKLGRIARLCSSFRYRGKKACSKIYALLFGKKISKSQRLSNWEAEVLTEAQQLYAATDAWACVEIYNYLDDFAQHWRL